MASIIVQLLSPDRLHPDVGHKHHLLRAYYGCVSRIIGWLSGTF
ncbi:hypothetical protein DDI_2532 [Dickeya dianthicola RNS04.9]|nr:hypothetical protein DDI_2532 [Dickeya dianthicola RNS04.9]